MSPPARGVRFPRARAALVAAAVAAAVLAAAFPAYYVFLVLPNDRRVDFPFPDIAAAPPREVVFDFVARAAEGRSTAGDAFARSDEPPASSAPAVAWMALERAAGAVVRRRALVSPLGSVIEFALVAPSSASLTFDYGVPPLPRAGGSRPAVRFIVDVVEPDGAVRVLFSDEVTPDRTARMPGLGFLYHLFYRPFHVRAAEAADPWRRARVDVALFAGRAVRLRFRTEVVPGPPPGEPEEDAVPPDVTAYWAGPALWRPRAGPGNDNLVLIVAESHLRAAGSAGGPVERFRREGVEFQRVYTNATTSAAALSALLSARPPSSPPSAESLPGVLRLNGYRVVAVGAAGLLAGASPADFDEVHTFPPDGYDPVRTARRAVDWLAAHPGEGPFALIVVLRDTARTSTPPLRFWPKTLNDTPWRAGGLARWRARAAQAYRDEYIDRLLDVLDAYRLWDGALGAVVALRGAELRPRMIGGSRRVPPPGVALTEDEVRTVWAMRHRSLTAGQSLSGPAQLVDVAPTFLRLLRLERPPAFQGTALEFTRAGYSGSGPAARVMVRGDGAKAMLVGGHYKYIRRAPSGGDGASSRFGEEEVYDLWTDPAESHNLVRAQRTLLARLRHAMEEADPDPVETRLSFQGLQGVPVQGSVETSAGELRGFWSEGATARLGSNRVDFEVADDGGTVSFDVWPPLAPFVLRLRRNGQVFAPEQIRVSKFGLALFERGGVEWYDHHTFPWLEGMSAPPAGPAGPLVLMGRVPSRLASTTVGVPEGVEPDLSGLEDER